MKLTRHQLDAAVRDNILSAAQAEQLWNFLVHDSAHQPHLSLAHVLYYFGGCIAIGAMTLFLTLGWDTLGGWGILLITGFYALLALSLCRALHRRGHIIPASLCAVFVVAITPLAIYGLQQALGFWPKPHHHSDIYWDIGTPWLYMELGTLLMGCLMLWRCRYPVLVLPIALTLGYMALDFAALLAEHTMIAHSRTLVTLVFCLGIIALALWVNYRSRFSADYAFWLYLVGGCGFWFSLTILESNRGLSIHTYCLVNVVLIFFGLVVLRRVFVILGALGCCGYLAHLAFSFFKHSLVFPLLLTVIGFLLIYLGICWQKHERALTLKLRDYLPHRWREALNRGLIHNPAT